MKEQAKQIDKDINRIEKEFGGGVANNYSIATRIPPSPTWMIGCLEDCRTGEFERIG